VGHTNTRGVDVALVGYPAPGSACRVPTSPATTLTHHRRHREPAAPPGPPPATIGTELTELEREKAGVEAALGRPFAHSETIKQLHTRASELQSELTALVGTDQREQVDEAAQVSAPPPTIAELLDESFPDLPIRPVTGRTGAASVAIGPRSFERHSDTGVER